MLRIFVFTFVNLLFSVSIFGQTAPNNFVFSQATPSDTSYSIEGWGQDYSSNTTYNLNFGSSSNNSAGIDYYLDAFEVGGETYTPITLPNGECYSRIEINRVANNQVSDLGFQTLFFEFGGRQGGGSNRQYHFLPTYTDMQEAVNRRIVNRGSDNVFANAGSDQTKNNVERIDLIVDGGIFTPDNTKAGFLLNERGGNDNFKVAAITSLGSSGQVESLGQLVYIREDQGHWGGTGQYIVSTVFMKSSSDPAMRPSQDLGSQEIYGVFVTFEDLGINDNDQIYGISVFPGDVDETMDLIGLTNVPTNTEASHGDGGLDLMGGGGFFASSDLSFITDLQSDITASKMAPDPNEVISVFLTISNNGPQDDANIIATLDIPDGYDYQGIVGSPAGTATYNNETITWELNSLDANQNEVLEIEVEALDNGGDRLFTSDVDGQLTDVTPGNNKNSLMLDLSTDDIPDPFPVSLLHLSFSGQSDHTLVQWATATEVNNDYFLIEKSVDGGAFEVIGHQEGHGNSNTVREYSFKDYQQTEGVSYYRLRQVDYDGSWELFGPVAISHQSHSNALTAYPNPAQELVTLGGLTAGAQVMLTNSAGQVHKQFMAEGTGAVINVSSLQPGIYILRVTTGTQTDTKKIMVQ